MPSRALRAIRAKAPPANGAARRISPRSRMSADVVDPGPGRGGLEPDVVHGRHTGPRAGEHHAARRLVGRDLVVHGRDPPAHAHAQAVPGADADRAGVRPLRRVRRPGPSCSALAKSATKANARRGGAVVSICSRRMAMACNSCIGFVQCMAAQIPHTHDLASRVCPRYRASTRGTDAMQVQSAAPSRRAAGAQPPPLERSSLAGLHAVQGVAILALSFAKDPLVTAPVVSSYLTFDTATSTLVPAQRALFDLPDRAGRRAVLLPQRRSPTSALAFPARGWYERSLARGMNPARWIEYALSSSVMIVVIADAVGDPGDRDAGRHLRHQRRDEPVRLEHGGSRTRAGRGRSGCTTSSAASPGVVPVDRDHHRALDGGHRARRRPHPRLRDRDLRVAVHQLQRVRLQHDPPVPEDRPLGRLPVRRARVHVPQPVREDDPRLAGLRRDASRRDRTPRRCGASRSR